MATNYIVYNLRTYFLKEPRQPQHCRMCGSRLSTSNIGPSKAVADQLDEPSLIPVHDYSLLFVCKTCGWWCVRESWILCEISRELDFLVVGAGPANHQSGGEFHHVAEPWLQVLEDPKLYDQAADFPAELARIFPSNGIAI